MKRCDRLRERERFQAVRRQGRCWSNRYLVLCALPNELGRTRFGFSASRRVGKAVVRNRARRRLREVFRLRQADIAPGWDIVVIARPPIVQAAHSELVLACQQLLFQAGLTEKSQES